MPINVQPSSTQIMCTSKHVSNCCAAGKRAMEYQDNPAHHFLKTFILKHIKQPVLSALLDLNGATLLSNQHLQGLLLDHPQMVGAADSRKLTPLLIQQIHTISESQVVVLDKYHLRLVSLHLDKLSR